MKFNEDFSEVFLTKQEEIEEHEKEEEILKEMGEKNDK